MEMCDDGDSGPYSKAVAVVLVLCVLERINDGKRYVDLAVRKEHHGKDLNDDESDGYSNLISSIYEADARFYASRIKITLLARLLRVIGTPIMKH